MNPQEFLRNSVEALAERFDITAKYQFNNQIDTHIIELSPADEFHYNKLLDKEWSKIVDNFENAFPGNELVFIGDDSLLKIDSPDFTCSKIEGSLPAFELLLNGNMIYQNNNDFLKSIFIPSVHYGISFFESGSIAMTTTIDTDSGFFSDTNAMIVEDKNISGNIIWANSIFIPEQRILKKGNTQYAEAA